MLMAQVDNAEAIAFGIFQHDEVRVLRVAVPVDPPSAKRYEPGRLSLLFADVGDMQIKVQARAALRRCLAELESDRRSSFAWRHEHPCPSAESILAQRVTRAADQNAAARCTSVTPSATTPKVSTGRA